MTLPTFSKQTVRRFVLGQQGLWPGRRWQGKTGTSAAMRYCEAVQIDPLNIGARNHDITLWSRVADYQPQYLSELCYDEHQFFDYCHILMLFPINELPRWRAIMRRNGARPYWVDFAAEHAELIDEVRATLRARGPLGNRDFVGRTRVESYYARKDTGLVLRYLWLTGELMTYGRRKWERLFHFRKHIVPPALLDREASSEDAEAFFVRKALRFLGMGEAGLWMRTFATMVERLVGRVEMQQRIHHLVEVGEVVAVQVEGHKVPWYVPSFELPLLETLAAGGVPHAWQPLETTTTDEAVLLAPLDIVSARGRAAKLFDFDYVWEVYKPAHVRRWGYYTLPILFGDQLVARIDPALDRKTGTLNVLGFWLEDSCAVDQQFATALARGLAHFARFVGAQRINIAALHPVLLHNHIQDVLCEQFEVAV